MIRTRLTWSTIGRRNFEGDENAKEFAALSITLDMPERVMQDDEVELKGILESELVIQVVVREKTVNDQPEIIMISEDTFDLFGTNFSYSVSSVTWCHDRRGLLLDCWLSSECTD